MNETTFKREMMKAKTFLESGQRPEYWAGYQRGLRRRYHGENFGTADEHQLWLDAAKSDYDQRRDRGQGYVAGYNLDRV